MLSGKNDNYLAITVPEIHPTDVWQDRQRWLSIVLLFGNGTLKK